MVTIDSNTYNGNLLRELILGVHHTHRKGNYEREHVNCPYNSNHFTVYMYIKSSCCTP